MPSFVTEKNLPVSSSDSAFPVNSNDSLRFVRDEGYGPKFKILLEKNPI